MWLLDKHKGASATLISTTNEFWSRGRGKVTLRKWSLSPSKHFLQQLAGCVFLSPLQNCAAELHPKPRAESPSGTNRLQLSGATTTVQNSSRGNKLHLERQNRPVESWALPVTWLCKWPGDRTHPLGSAGLWEAESKPFKGCSLLWSGKLLSVYGSLGFCVWLTDYALRQCLEMGSAAAPGLSGAAEGAHPLLQKYLQQLSLHCPAWLQ